MISINNLTYFIGNRPLYEDTSLFIKETDKIGLIGINGSGKSTLLKIINGDIAPEKGKINKSKDITIGYLDQDMLSVDTEESILTIVMKAFKSLISTQKKIDELLKEIEQNYTEEALIKLTDLQEKFGIEGGYEAQSKAEKVLEGIGFQTTDLERPLSSFSGGWRMRVILAKLLLEKPSLLMLDEPTNHLDIVSIKWLESYLINLNSAFIVISHDRSFLDKVTKNIIEVDQKKLIHYVGNYTAYLKEKELRRELQHNAFINQQKKIKETQKFISRFRAKSSKASQVQSRIKSLDKLDKIEDISNFSKVANINFNILKPSGKEVICIENVSKNYGNKEIFKDISLKINRGDKIALIGPNGKGKSTLLKIISKITNFNGEVKTGYNVDISFYGQHQLESLNLQNDIFTEVKSINESKTEVEIRTILGMLLFNKDSIKKKIKVLSGGEKARVAIAKMMLSGANFLILDEPTNHLDMFSIEILIKALQNYQGSLIFVSHNEYFIDKLAKKIWFIHNKKIKEYPDNYDSFQFWLKNTNQNL